MKVMHVIAGLNRGGAEVMLARLLPQLRASAVDGLVISLTTIGPVGKQIEQMGIPVRALGMRRKLPDPRGVWRLVEIIRHERPCVIHTWMDQANLIGSAATLFTGRQPVVWGIHHTTLDPEASRKRRWTAKINARSARYLPNSVIYCADAARSLHEVMGYPIDRGVVIPNGFDLHAHRPDSEARKTVRDELRIPDDARLVGIIGRFDPHKDFRTFLSAGAKLSSRLPGVYFAMCGDGLSTDNAELVGWVDEFDLRSNCLLLGPRNDIARIQASLDLGTLSSLSEALPLVVGETMACGVPCVVTDVGDSARLVGDTGLVVPPRDPEALAAAWFEVLAMTDRVRSALGFRARQRIADLFSLDTTVKKYTEVYNTVVDGRSRSCHAV
jgi:glycosyltransferase involved in cell wall biosynthesis